MNYNEHVSGDGKVFYSIDDIHLAFTADDVKKDTWPALKKQLIENVIQLYETSIYKIERELKHRETQ